MRVVVLGYGSIGQRHAANLAVLGVEVMVHDSDGARIEAAGSQSGIRVAWTLDDVWRWKPQAAVVAVPSFEHVTLAREAARRDVDLFVEKPLGHERSGLDDLLGEADRRRLVTLVGCNMRFHPGPATVKRLLDEGAVGTVVAARLKTGSYLPEWRPGQDYRCTYSASRLQGGGALLDCIHEVDLALWMFGPARLAGSIVLPAGVLGLDVDGLAELLLKHASGAVSSVHLNFVQRNYRRGCEIVGETGTIEWDFATPEVSILRGSGLAAERYALPTGWTTNQMYLDEMRHFIDCVTLRQPTTAPLEQGVAALAIALEARDSAARGACL